MAANGYRLVWEVTLMLFYLFLWVLPQVLLGNSESDRLTCFLTMSAYTYPCSSAVIPETPLPKARCGHLRTLLVRVSTRVARRSSLPHPQVSTAYEILNYPPFPFYLLLLHPADPCTLCFSDKPGL